MIIFKNREYNNNKFQKRKHTLFRTFTFKFHSLSLQSFHWMKRTAQQTFLEWQRTTFVLCLLHFHYDKWPGKCDQITEVEIKRFSSHLIVGCLHLWSHHFTYSIHSVASSLDLFKLLKQIDSNKINDLDLSAKISHIAKKKHLHFK